MIKRYLHLFILWILPFGACAQSLSVSIQGSPSGNNIFTLAGGQVALSETQIEFQETGVAVRNYLDYGVSPDLSVVGFLTNSGDGSRAVVVDSKGDTLAGFDVTSLSAGDPSVAVYPFNTGGVLVRNNIAGFSLYDSFGNIVSRVSSSSQSREGEAISGVAMDPHAQTVVIYNPRIKRNGKLGSHAYILDARNELESIYSNTQRTIKDVLVSEDGQYIILLTGSTGDDDKAIVMDRFGNELNIITTDEDLTGARISEDARYITLFSERRILVYSTLEGERQGSTSFRSSVVLANYFPADDIILGMTGSYAPARGIADNIEFHAIHLGKRKIAREDFNPRIRFDDALNHRFVRTGSGRYRLEGTNKQIEIRAAF